MLAGGQCCSHHSGPVSSQAAWPHPQCPLKQASVLFLQRRKEQLRSHKSPTGGSNPSLRGRRGQLSGGWRTAQAVCSQ